MIGAVDTDVLEWLQTMNEEGHLNNTLVIIMSDHGPR
jgi:arylsulfatase A-like enzyme